MAETREKLEKYLQETARVQIIIDNNNNNNSNNNNDENWMTIIFSSPDK